MAEAAKKKRVIKTESAREKTEEVAAKTVKPPKRRIRRSASVVMRPFKFLRFLRFIIPPYFRNSWKELKQVTWPNRKETRQLTVAVFIFAIAFGILVAVTDYGLDKIFKKVLLK